MSNLNNSRTAGDDHDNSQMNILDSSIKNIPIEVVSVSHHNTVDPHHYPMTLEQSYINLDFFADFEKPDFNMLKEQLAQVVLDAPLTLSEGDNPTSMLGRSVVNDIKLLPSSTVTQAEIDNYSHRGIFSPEGQYSAFLDSNAMLHLTNMHRSEHSEHPLPMRLETPDENNPTEEVNFPKLKWLSSQPWVYTLWQRYVYFIEAHPKVQVHSFDLTTSKHVYSFGKGDPPQPARLLGAFENSNLLCAQEWDSQAAEMTSSDISVTHPQHLYLYTPHSLYLANLTWSPAFDCTLSHIHFNNEDFGPIQAALLTHANHIVVVFDKHEVKINTDVWAAYLRGDRDKDLGKYFETLNYPEEERLGNFTTTDGENLHTFYHLEGESYEGVLFDYKLRGRDKEKLTFTLPGANWDRLGISILNGVMAAYSPGHEGVPLYYINKKEILPIGELPFEAVYVQCLEKGKIAIVSYKQKIIVELGHWFDKRRTQIIRAIPSEGERPFSVRVVRDKKNSCYFMEFFRRPQLQCISIRITCYHYHNLAYCKEINLPNMHEQLDRVSSISQVVRENALIALFYDSHSEYTKKIGYYIFWMDVQHQHYEYRRIECLSGTKIPEQTKQSLVKIIDASASMLVLESSINGNAVEKSLMAFNLERDIQRHEVMRATLQHKRTMDTGQLDENLLVRSKFIWFLKIQEKVVSETSIYKRITRKPTMKDGIQNQNYQATKETYYLTVQCTNLDINYRTDFEYFLNDNKALELLKTATLSQNGQTLAVAIPHIGKIRLFSVDPEIDGNLDIGRKLTDGMGIQIEGLKENHDTITTSGFVFQSFGRLLLYWYVVEDNQHIAVLDVGQKRVINQFFRDVPEGVIDRYKIKDVFQCEKVDYENLSPRFNPAEFILVKGIACDECFSISGAEDRFSVKTRKDQIIYSFSFESETNSFLICKAQLINIGTLAIQRVPYAHEPGNDYFLTRLNIQGYMAARRQSPPDEEKLANHREYFINYISLMPQHYWRNDEFICKEVYKLDDEIFFKLFLDKVVRYEKLVKSYNLLLMVLEDPKNKSVKGLTEHLRENHRHFKISSVLESKDIQDIITDNYVNIMSNDRCKDFLVNTILIPTGHEVEADLKDETRSVILVKMPQEHQTHIPLENQVKPLLNKIPERLRQYMIYEPGFSLDISKGSHFSSCLFNIIQSSGKEQLTGIFKGLVYYKWRLYLSSVIIYAVVFWTNMIFAYIYFGFFYETPWLGAVIIILSSLLLAFELKCMISLSRGNTKYKNQLESKKKKLISLESQFLEYAKSFSNFFDLLSLGFTIIASITIMRNEQISQMTNDAIVVWLRMIPVVFLGCRSITWLRINRQTRYLITSVLKVFLTMVPFLIILVGFIMIFSFVWRLVDGLSGENYFEEITFYDSLIITINIIFGNVINPLENSSRPFPKIKLFIWIIGNVVLALTLLNFLIAVLSEVFEETTENKDYHDLNELLVIIQDFDHFYSGFPCFGHSHTNDKLLLLVENSNDDEVLKNIDKVNSNVVKINHAIHSSENKILVKTGKLNEGVVEKVKRLESKLDLVGSMDYSKINKKIDTLYEQNDKRFQELEAKLSRIETLLTVTAAQKSYNSVQPQQIIMGEGINLYNDHETERFDY